MPVDDLFSYRPFIRRNVGSLVCFGAPCSFLVLKARNAQVYR